MNDNNFPLIEKLRASFHRRPSAEQKKIKKYGTIGFTALVLLGIYYLTGQNDKKPRVPEVKQEVTADKTAGLIQDDIITTLNGRIDEQNQNIKGSVQDAVAQAFKEGKFGLTPPPGGINPNALNSTELTAGPEQQVGAASGNAQANNPNVTDYPGMSNYPAPAGYGGDNSRASQNAQDSQQEEKSVIWVGDISEGNDDVGLSTPATDSAEKKNTIQLPVGFMKAKLLVGVNALTGQYGSENPQTLMFRVQAPAQLPNFIRMNLRGCFNIANVSGNLSSERIIVLPVSIHCMTMDGKYIVEGNVKGFVSDADGKRDMSARVVSRAGRLLAATVFAKSIEGFANVIGQQSIQQNTSALGSVNTIKPGEATQNAAATGVAGGFTEVSKYLLNLAQQTSPALETGPGKDVMLFIQETAELTIREVRIK